MLAKNKRYRACPAFPSRGTAVYAPRTDGGVGGVSAQLLPLSRSAQPTLSLCHRVSDAPAPTDVSTRCLF